jgi:hypothetical protein
MKIQNNLMMKHLLSFLFLHFFIFGHAQSIIYVVNNIGNAIEMIDPVNGNSSVFEEGLMNPQDIAYDPLRSALYVSDPGNQKIFKITHNDLTTLVDGTEALDLELSPDQSSLFWTTVDEKVMQYRFLDGTTEVLVEGNSVNFYGLAIGPDSSVYIADWQNDQILKTDLEGSTLDPWLTDLGDVWDIEVDPIQNKVYWSQSEDNLLQRADADGSNPEVILSDIGAVKGLSIDLSVGQLYFAVEKIGPNPYKIQRSNLDGTALVTLVEYSPFDAFFPFGVEVGEPLLTSTNERDLGAQVRVFPNPGSEEIRIETDGDQLWEADMEYFLLDQTGRIHVRSRSPLIEVKNLPAGPYCIQLFENGQYIVAIPFLKVNAR